VGLHVEQRGRVADVQGVARQDLGGRADDRERVVDAGALGRGDPARVDAGALGVAARSRSRRERVSSRT
jgi:hypothetical protein